MCTRVSTLEGYDYLLPPNMLLNLSPANPYPVIFQSPRNILALKSIIILSNVRLTLNNIVSNSILFCPNFVMLHNKRGINWWPRTHREKASERNTECVMNTFPWPSLQAGDKGTYTARPLWKPSATLAKCVGLRKQVSASTQQDLVCNIADTFTFLLPYLRCPNSLKNSTWNKITLWLEA